MRKARLTDAILEKAARMVVEEDFQEQNEKATKAPHIFSPEFHEKMNRVFASADAFTVHNQSDTESENEPFLQQLDHKQKNHPSPLVIPQIYRDRGSAHAGSIRGCTRQR